MIVTRGIGQNANSAPHVATIGYGTWVFGDDTVSPQDRRARRKLRHTQDEQDIMEMLTVSWSELWK